MLAQDVIAMTMMMLKSVGPRIEASTIARTIQGSTRNQFVTALRTVSTFVPPK